MKQRNNKRQYNVLSENMGNNGSADRNNKKQWNRLSEQWKRTTYRSKENNLLSEQNQTSEELIEKT